MTKVALTILMLTTGAGGYTHAQLPPANAKALKAWRAEFRRLDPHKLIIKDSDLNPSELNTLVIMVGDGWQLASKSDRLDLAVGFQRAWAAKNAANQPDPERCRIFLVTQVGRHIGGSRESSASTITVDD